MRSNLCGSSLFNMLSIYTVFSSFYLWGRSINRFIKCSTCVAMTNLILLIKRLILLRAKNVLCRSILFPGSLAPCSLRFNMDSIARNSAGSSGQRSHTMMPLTTSGNSSSGPNDTVAVPMGYVRKAISAWSRPIYHPSRHALVFHVRPITHAYCVQYRGRKIAFGTAMYNPYCSIFAWYELFCR